MSDRLRAAMSNFGCHFDRRKGISKRRTGLPREKTGERKHRKICDLDAAEAVTPRQRDAIAKVFSRAKHPATRVFSIAEAAQGGRFQFCGSCSPRMIEAKPMFAETAFQFASREQNIAVQQVSPSSLTYQRQSDGNSFSAPDIR